MVAEVVIEAACPTETATAEGKVVACSPGTGTAVADELVRVWLPVLPGQDQLVRVWLPALPGQDQLVRVGLPVLPGQDQLVRVRLPVLPVFSTRDIFYILFFTKQF